MTRVPLVLVGLAATVALAACGSASASGTSTPAATPAAAAGTSGRTVQFPGARGLIAEVDGTTLQVQSTTSQTAVTYSGTTKLTKVVAGTLKDVTVGECVTVRSTTASSSATAANNTGPITAATIAVSQPVNGTCTFGIAGEGGTGVPGGFGGAAGRTRTFTPGADGFPTDRPTGEINGFRLFGVTGKVLAISGDTITVQPDGRRFAGGATGTATATATEAPETVTTTSSTTVTTTVAAKAADIVVGECATAIGTASDTGAITATTISLEQAVNGQCPVAGFGGDVTGTGR